MEIQGYNMPDDLYYEENHYWIRVEGDILVMGMDDFARQLAGEIVYVQLPVGHQGVSKRKFPYGQGSLQTSLTKERKRIGLLERTRRTKPKEQIAAIIL